MSAFQVRSSALHRQVLLRACEHSQSWLLVSPEYMIIPLESNGSSRLSINQSNVHFATRDLLKEDFARESSRLPHAWKFMSYDPCATSSRIPSTVSMSSGFAGTTLNWIRSNLERGVTIISDGS